MGQFWAIKNKGQLPSVQTTNRPCLLSFAAKADGKCGLFFRFFKIKIRQSWRDGRRPMLLFTLDRLLLLRLPAQRQLFAVLFQLPPRLPRFDEAHTLRHALQKISLICMIQKSNQSFCFPSKFRLRNNTIV